MEQNITLRLSPSLKGTFMFYFVSKKNPLRRILKLLPARLDKVLLFKVSRTE